MRLKVTFECVELDDHIVAVPVGEGAQNFRGVIKLNETAAEIFDLLKDETTEEAIITELNKRYGDDPEIVGFVREMIEYLMNEGALE